MLLKDWTVIEENLTNKYYEIYLLVFENKFAFLTGNLIPRIKKKA